MKVEHAGDWTLIASTPSEVEVLAGILLWDLAALEYRNVEEWHPSGAPDCEGVIVAISCGCVTVYLIGEDLPEGHLTELHACPEHAGTLLDLGAGLLRIELAHAEQGDPWVMPEADGRLIPHFMRRRLIALLSSGGLVVTRRV